MITSNKVIIAALGLLMAFSGKNVSAKDFRELVEFPEMMQEHMMSNMRDHLVALEEILAALAEGNPDSATEIAETRLGMSSLDLHGAARVAKYMPEPMQAMGTDLHRAASRFVIAVQDAEIEQSYQSQQIVFGALRDVGAACNSCHSAYRLR